MLRSAPSGKMSVPIMKSVRDLQNAILQADLMPTEKLVGLCVAFHINRTTQATRLRQSTIAEECGLSVRSVKRAFKALRDAGLLEMKATGRSPIIHVCTGNNTGNVEGPREAPQRGHERRKMPWEYDTTLSTVAEEQDKRERERLAREVECR